MKLSEKTAKKLIVYFYQFQLNVLRREQSRVKNLRGVALTGWSRYDHFSVLCELLPVAVPSMILSLQILIYQNLEKASTEMFKLLKCDGGSLSKMDDCQWDGADLSSALGTLQFYQVITKPSGDLHMHELL